jgi:hypothetical protein
MNNRPPVSLLLLAVAAVAHATPLLLGYGNLSLSGFG